MDSRNWRGIVISVITSAVLVVGNTGMAFADAEQFNEDGEADPAVSQELVRDVDGNWISADIEEPQDFDEEEETEDSLQEENEEEKDEMLDELIDRFGEPPRPVQNLLRVAQLKAEAHSLYFVEIKESSNDITFRMFERAKVNGSNIPLVVEKNKPLLSFVPDKKEPYFYYRKQKNSPDTIEVICRVLADCRELLTE